MEKVKFAQPPTIRREDSLNFNCRDKIEFSKSVDCDREKDSFGTINKILENLNVGYAVFNPNLSMINCNKLIYNQALIETSHNAITYDDNKDNSIANFDEFLTERSWDFNLCSKPLLASEDDFFNVTRKFSLHNYEDNKVKTYIENMLNSLYEVNDFFDDDMKERSNTSVVNILSNNMNASFQNFQKNRKKFWDLHEFVDNLRNKLIVNTSMEDEFITVGVARIAMAEEIKHMEIKVRIIAAAFKSCDFSLFSNNNNYNYQCEFYVNDVTKVKDAEVSKNQMRYKSMGLAKVAHEFKNPIFTLTTLIKELDNVVDDNNSHYEDDHSHSNNQNGQMNQANEFNPKLLMHNLCNYLLILIEDFNSYAKLEIDKVVTKQTLNNCNAYTNNDIIALKEIQLRPILEFCINIFRIRQKYENKENIQIRLVIDEEVPKFIISNEVKLKQVLVNLLSNAYKFTLHGSITVSVKMEGVDLSDNNIIRISVKDSGIGMTSEEQQSLFNPFKMLDSGKGYNQFGTGLGLLIIKDILNKMGSQICLESEKGSGTTFWFDLKESENVTLINTNVNMNLNLHSTFQDETVIIDPNLVYTDSLINIIKSLNEQSSNYSLMADSPERRIKDIEDKIILESLDEESSLRADKPDEERDFVQLQVRRKKSEQDINRVSRIMKKISNRTISRFQSKNNLVLKNLAPNTNKKLNILLCDDETIVTNSAKKNFEKILKERNIEYEIDVFHSGIECLYNIFQERKNQRYYDLLIIDESMPFMRGSLVVSTLQTLIEENELKDIIMYISSSYEDVAARNHLKCGVLRKPITYESILSMLIERNLI